MKKSELKTGMVVKRRDGLERVVALGHWCWGDCLLMDVKGDDYYILVEDYVDGLNHRNDADFDILEVFEGGCSIWERNKAKYKELTPHEAMIKLMDDGEFECELKDHNEWVKTTLIGVKPKKPAPFCASGRNHYFKCRIKEENS